MDATCAIQASIHVFSLVRKYVSGILGTYHSPAGLIRIFTCKGLPALSAELHLALVPEEVPL